MEQKTNAYKPLVYIDQPTTFEPSAPMQEYFESTQDDKTPESMKDTRQIEQRPYMHAQSFWDEYEENKEKKKSSTKQEKFSELSNRGKINYLLKRPQFIPTLTCQIETTKGRFYGKIANFKDDTVYLRLSRSRATKKIAYDTIESIHLVGF